jgi:hypothetical protein
VPKHLPTQMATSKAKYVVETRDIEESALLKLGLLKGDEDGCAETLDDPDGDVEDPVDGGDESFFLLLPNTLPS